MSEMRNFLENEKIAQVSAAMIIVEQANKIKDLDAKLKVAVEALEKINKGINMGPVMMSNEAKRTLEKIKAKQ